jgi:Mrp family chromosome partitioning ATPase
MTYHGEPSKERILEVLEKVLDPELGVSIVKMNMVKDVKIENGLVEITLALTVSGCPMVATIRTSVEEAVRKVEGVKAVRVNFVTMTEEERRKVLPPGFIPDRRLKLLKLPKGEIRRMVAIASGKGGVGKSSLTALLAVELKRAGLEVGILDGDLTGPSIAKVFGVARAEVNPSGIRPALTRSGIKIISMNLLLGDEELPVIWRGPLIHNALRQLYTNVLWGSLDYLLVDLPPGTSDAPLTVFQSLPLDGVVVITTPQDLARMVVMKAVNMARGLRVPLLGVVENMGYLRCPKCGEKIELYGPSHAQDFARTAAVPFLGALPLDPELSLLCDQGRIEDYRNPALIEIVKAMTSRINRYVAG